jgi:hypothetical protein
MSDPNIAPIIKKLLSLDTPVARRIFEIALLLLLIVGASYLMQRYKGTPVEFAAGTVAILGSLVVFLMMLILVATIVGSAKSDIGPDKKEVGREPGQPPSTNN